MSVILFDDSMQSKIVNAVLGFVTAIESHFIRARIKETFAKHKPAAMVLGHFMGLAKKLQLQPFPD